MNENKFIIKNGVVVESTSPETAVFEIEGSNGLLVSINDTITGNTFSVSNLTGGTALGIDAEGDISVERKITASEFIKSGGTSTQFLKADGSSDSSSYSQVGHTHPYLSDTGGTVSGNLYIAGDLVVTGSTYQTHTNEIFSKNDYITLREGAVSGLANGAYTGIEAIKYDGVNNGRLVFDNQGWARVGDSGNEQVITTRISSPGNTQVAIWDAANYRLNFIPQSTFAPASGSPNYIQLSPTNAQTGNIKITSSIYWGSGAGSSVDASGLWIEQVGTNTINENIRIQTSKSGDLTNYISLVLDPTSGFQFNATGTGNGIATFNSTISSTGFIKSGSSDSYILLGAGGHKAVSDFVVSSVLGNYSLTGHTHDDRYYTETESNARYLGISAKAVDSDKLDGNDSTYFAAASSLSNYSLTGHTHNGVYEPVFTKNTAFNKNFGTIAGTVAEGNDARLSDARTPLSHTHGNISNDGKIGTTASLPILTGTGGTLVAKAAGLGTQFLNGLGEWATPPNTIYTLPTATASVLGGVKIGSNVTITNGIISVAAPYVHPTTSGNNHIPSGGVSGNILKWSADGTAVWGAEYSYSLPLAASGTRGGIQIGYVATGANLPLLLSSEKAYVALTKSAIESVLSSGVSLGTILLSSVTHAAPIVDRFSGVSSSGVALARIRNNDYDIGLGMSLSGNLITGLWSDIDSLSTAWKVIYHSGNSNLTTIDWSAKNLTLAGSIAGATTIAASSTISALGGNSTQWNTAYGWGNHASAGYASASSLHNAVTLGTANGLSLSTQILSLALATTTTNGAMSGADKLKLDGIAASANNYSLPTATASVLGGVKIGTNVDIASGVISVHNPVTIGTANGLSLSTQALSLALATTTTNGAMSAADKVKLDGVATGANNYVHPSSHSISFITGLQSALDGKSNTSHTHTSLYVPDTRAVVSVPENLEGRALQLDFKNNTSVGNPPITASPTYSHIISFAGWNAAEGSGGYPSQMSIGDGIAVRQAVNATTWGIWRNVYHTGNLLPVTTSANGLMSATDKVKLDGVATGANNYSHPAYTSRVAGLYKVTVDASGHVSAVAAVAKGDITVLGIPAQDTTYAAATTTVAGLMSAADKVKLDGVATGAKTGTVTSVAMTVPTGLSISGTPITTSGTLALSLTSGYSIPTTAKQTNWDSAYTHSQSAHQTIINGTGFVKASGTTLSYDNNQYAPMLSATATVPAAAGWYRIATSPLDVVRCSGRFEIDWSVSSYHGQVIINAGIMYSTDPTLNVIHYSHFGTGFTKARIVYHTTYSGNYAYLEIYKSNATATATTIQLFSPLGWTLVTPSTVGSIPTGYASQELTFYDGIATEGQLVSAVATGTAPLAVSSTTVVSNLNADMLDGLHSSSFATSGHAHAILTRGTYLTGANYNGSADTTWAVDATSANTASKVVARDASGNFSAGTITAALSGNATTATTATKLGTATVGSTQLPFYLNAGTATAITQADLRIGLFGTTAIGSTQLPIYLAANGVPTAITQANLRIGLFGATAIGTSTNPVYIAANGVPTASTSFGGVTGIGTASPLMDGTVAVGTSSLAARQDHRHPIDTSRAAVGQTMYIGTTAVAINRASGALALSGISTLAMSGALSGATTIAATTSMTSPAYYHSSDMTLKNVIKPLEPTLDKLRDMDTFYYTLKSDITEKVQLGMSAQEFEDKFPTLVGKDSNDKLQLEYARIAVLAVKAIQELDTIQQKYEERVEDLQNQINELKQIIYGANNNK